MGVIIHRFKRILAIAREQFIFDMVCERTSYILINMCNHDTFYAYNFAPAFTYSLPSSLHSNTRTPY